MPAPAEPTVTESDLTLDDGRTLQVGDRLAVFWHHGTPDIGSPPRPLSATAERLGGPGATSRPRTDFARVADAFGIERFTVMGHSGGSTHALACGAPPPGRVIQSGHSEWLARHLQDALAWFTDLP
ncbi:MAG: hypothetical protein J2P24_02485 [Streptosporangiales bacterium]|nr:hypothetical protein [Streptosporangiales bacterium]MBO0889634.1 hypothetical protein [Acidothermales bacterium]